MDKEIEISYYLHKQPHISDFFSFFFQSKKKCEHYSSFVGYIKTDGGPDLAQGPKGPLPRKLQELFYEHLINIMLMTTVMKRKMIKMTMTTEMRKSGCEHQEEFSASAISINQVPLFRLHIASFQQIFSYFRYRTLIFYSTVSCSLVKRSFPIFQIKHK